MWQRVYHRLRFRASRTPCSFRPAFMDPGIVGDGLELKLYGLLMLARACARVSPSLTQPGRAGTNAA
jgi:hypothetical protein